MARRPSGLNDRKSLKRFRRYALVAGGAVGVVAPTSADASIVFYDPVDVTVGVGDRAQFDMYTGDVRLFEAGGKKVLFKSISSAFVIRSFTGRHTITSSAKIKTKKNGRNGSSGIAGSYAGYGTFEVGRYQTGDKISSKNFFSSNGYFYEDKVKGGKAGVWGGGGQVTGFVGLSFNNPNLSGNLFGWARITVDAANDTVTLLEFAYENVAGANIVVGDTGRIIATPEPSSLAMWAAGAMGVVAFRRRKKKVAEQAG